MKENFNISQLDNKIFSLNIDKLEKVYLENFKKHNTSLAVSVMWPGIVLFSLMWSYISYGIIFAGIMFLGQYIPLLAIDFNFSYFIIFSIVYFIFFLLLVTTQQLKIEYARHYASGFYRGLNCYKENFQWAKENLSKQEFNYLVKKEFKVEKSSVDELLQKSEVNDIKKTFIEKLTNPSEGRIVFEQFIFFIIAGISIYVSWETEWRWKVVIASIVVWIFLLALRDNPNNRN